MNSAFYRVAPDTLPPYDLRQPTNPLHNNASSTSLIEIGFVLATVAINVERSEG